MTIRLFIGIELPLQVRRLLYGVSATLMGKLDGAKWVPQDNIHLTLEFLGSTPENKLDDIEEAIRKATKKFRKFYFSLGPVGGFPNERKARVLWIGVHHGSAELGALSSIIKKALKPLGFESENRPFSPHITLARFKTPKSIEDAVAEISPAAPAGRIVNVEGITIFQSELKRSGAEYTSLRRITLNP